MKKTTSVHRRLSAARALGAALLTAVLSASALAAVVPLKDARMKIELNATDGDVGIQLFIDADPWKTMEVFDPMGIRVFSAVTSGRVGLQGGTEFFMESAEPSFSQLSLAAFLQRFPVGDYRVQGEGLNGDTLLGSARFTHNIPQAPQLLSPGEDAQVDPNRTVVQWSPVPAANGSPIVGYQVLVVKPGSGFAAIPKLVLDIMMPATATSLAVPGGFLLPNSAYDWEVLAIEAGGNQTLSVGHFMTAAVPEPSTYLMLGLGLAVLVAKRRLRTV